jgi:ubiquinone/menaquinone biosynthesis C-methylase UbiE
MKRLPLNRAVRLGLPAALLGIALTPAARRLRPVAGGLLLAFWTAVYLRYRRASIATTADERRRLESVNWDAFWRHYNERVPTVEEEMDMYTAYHRHRHEMRYELLAEAVRSHLPRGGTVLDVGCGSALVAELTRDLNGHYVGLDFGGHHIEFAAKKLRETPGPLRCSFVRADGEHLPIADGSVDLLVMSEVIEHLLRPELAVWEVARVLRPGGVFVMTTNNASEMPLKSPLSHLFAWLEKAFGATHPKMISLRPWIWPERVDPTILPDGSPDVYVPHTHHIMGETRTMFAAAGLDTFEWSTFEFPPPQSKTALWLDSKGTAGRRAVDGVEAIARRTPLVRRMGAHLFMLARRNDAPLPAAPPQEIWPGPFSNGSTLRRTSTA